VFPLLRVISRFKPAFYPGTIDRAGQVLAEATLARSPTGRTPLPLLVEGEVTYPDPSKLARDDHARDLLCARAPPWSASPPD